MTLLSNFCTLLVAFLGLLSGVQAVVIRAAGEDASNGDVSKADISKADVSKGIVHKELSQKESPTWEDDLNIVNSKGLGSEGDPPAELSHKKPSHKEHAHKEHAHKGHAHKEDALKGESLKGDDPEEVGMKIGDSERQTPKKHAPKGHDSKHYITKGRPSRKDALTGSPSQGCKKLKHLKHFERKTMEMKLKSSSGHRTFRIHLPSNYNSKTAKPLLIAYHGQGSNPRKFEIQTRFSDEEINPDMIVVYPAASLKGLWHGVKDADTKVDDKVFTTELVNFIKKEYCVDESRVYATGHSIGGGFNNVLACSSHGEQFAAFAPVSGTFFSKFQPLDKCKPARSPMPIFEVHGTADKKVPYAGLKSGGADGLIPIEKWVQGWAKRNMCQEPATPDSSKEVQDYKYTCQKVEDGLEHIKVEGMGHGWPEKGSKLEDVSLRIIEFLNKHQKPEAAKSKPVTPPSL